MGFLSKHVSGTDDSLTSSRLLFRASSFTFDTYNALLFSDAFSIRGSKPYMFPIFCFAVTLVASRPQDAFTDLIANLILGATIVSKAVKSALWILSSTVSRKLLVSLSIFPIKHLSKVFIFTVFSLVIKLLPGVPSVKFRSQVPSLTTVSSCVSLVVLP